MKIVTFCPNGDGPARRGPRRRRHRRPDPTDDGRSCAGVGAARTSCAPARPSTPCVKPSTVPGHRPGRIMEQRTTARPDPAPNSCATSCSSRSTSALDGLGPRRVVRAADPPGGNPDTVFGPDDEILALLYTDKLDYELEVAAVLGRAGLPRGGRRGAGEHRRYTIFNDWSARDIQLREMSVGLGPAFGKDFATSMGPVLVTADEFDTDASMSARSTARRGRRFTRRDAPASPRRSPLSAEQPCNPATCSAAALSGADAVSN